MKDPGMNHATFYGRCFAIVVAALIGFAVVKIFEPFAGALTWAAFLAFLMHPLNLRLREKTKGSALAAATLTVLTPIVILLPLAAVSVEFVAQISVLVVKLQIAARQFDVHNVQDFAQIPWVSGASDWLQKKMDVNPTQLQTWAVSGTQEFLQRAAGIGSSVFLGTMSTLVGFVLMLFLLFFFLRDGDAMFGQGRRLIPMDEKRKSKLISHLSDLTRAIVFGTTVTALFQGLTVGIGFAICGLPSPVVFGVLAALLSMLPVGGTAFIWIPAAIWLFVDGRWGFGVFMLVWGSLSSLLDNVLRPLLISGRAPISTLAVFLGVLGGISAFGAIGFIVGPIILSLALVLMQFAEETQA